MEFDILNEWKKKENEMNTHAVIAAQYDEEFGGGFVGSYCHCDGYILSGVGQELIEEHNSKDDAFAVADFGYMSTLCKYDSYNHALDDPSYNCDTIQEMMEFAEGCDYLYVYMDDAWWVCTFQKSTLEGAEPRELLKLSDVLMKLFFNINDFKR